jgi:hypothetical protein
MAPQQQTRHSSSDFSDKSSNGNRLDRVDRSGKTPGLGILPRNALKLLRFIALDHTDHLDQRNQQMWTCSGRGVLVIN